MGWFSDIVSDVGDFFQDEVIDPVKDNVIDPVYEATIKPINDLIQDNLIDPIKGALDPLRPEWTKGKPTEVLHTLSKGLRNPSEFAQENFFNQVKEFLDPLRPESEQITKILSFISPVIGGNIAKGKTFDNWKEAVREITPNEFKKALPDILTAVGYYFGGAGGAALGRAAGNAMSQELQEESVSGREVLQNAIEGYQYGSMVNSVTNVTGLSLRATGSKVASEAVSGVTEEGIKQGISSTSDIGFDSARKGLSDKTFGSLAGASFKSGATGGSGMGFFDTSLLDNFSFTDYSNQVMNNTDAFSNLFFNGNSNILNSTDAFLNQYGGVGGDLNDIWNFAGSNGTSGSESWIDPILNSLNFSEGGGTNLGDVTKLIQQANNIFGGSQQADNNGFLNGIFGSDGGIDLGKLLGLGYAGYQGDKQNDAMQSLLNRQLDLQNASLMPQIEYANQTLPGLANLTNQSTGAISDLMSNQGLPPELSQRLYDVANRQLTQGYGDISKTLGNQLASRGTLQSGIASDAWLDKVGLPLAQGRQDLATNQMLNNYNAYSNAIGQAQAQVGRVPPPNAPVPNANLLNQTNWGDVGSAFSGLFNKNKPGINPGA